MNGKSPVEIKGVSTRLSQTLSTQMLKYNLLQGKHSQVLLQKMAVQKMVLPGLFAFSENSTVNERTHSSFNSREFFLPGEGNTEAELGLSGACFGDVFTSEILQSVQDTKA